jgi:hypothetical protein
MPLWAIGLVLAALAPFAVRFIASAFDAHARRRTLTAITASKAQAGDFAAKTPRRQKKETGG